jgi:hypothetical protein
MGFNQIIKNKKFQVTEYNRIGIVEQCPFQKLSENMIK